MLIEVILSLGATSNLGYIHTVPNEFSTGPKFRPGILFTRNRAKVSFCSDETDNRMKFVTLVSGFTISSCAQRFFNQMQKRTPTSVRRRSSRVDFRLRNPSSPDVVFVMKALFSILDPQNRVETNTCFVFAHDFVLRYLHFFPLLTYITDSNKFLRCLLFTDGRLQLQHSNTSTKSVKTEKKTDSQNFPLIVY